ncbi:MAG: polysaccharide biosynthesis/export family protein [Pirellulales bacterium]|nr:polysaccharide biosynthesis/export family protein [Planctomycetales bacterium]
MRQIGRCRPLCPCAVAPLRADGGRLAVLATLLALSLSGCQSLYMRDQVLMAQIDPSSPVPRELAKISFPEYRVAPPDVLLIDAVKVIPKSPYQIEPLDLLQISVLGTPDDPASQIYGIYRVDSAGMVNLGPSYGKVSVLDLTTDEAADHIYQMLSQILLEPQVSVSLAEPAAKQQIIGEHIVGPDGTVNLGVYGNVYVAGMTVAETKAAVEQHLTAYLEQPEVAVDVFAYNSQVYYIITQGAGQGDSVFRFPATGNETVLDAIAQVQGLSAVSSRHIWIARPAPDALGCDQILPVDWRAITQGGSTATNYQLLPGDRLFVQEDKLIAFGTFVDKVVGPFERMFGFTLLGFQTIQTANRFPTGSYSNLNQNPGFGF